MNIVQKLISALLISLATISAGTLKTPHSIVLTFNQYPIIESTQNLTDRNDIPSVIDPKNRAFAYSQYGPHHRIKEFNPKKIHTVSLSGVPVIYYGFITYSKKDGIVMLPRMHETREFYVLLSTKISPVFMLKNTVHHLEITKGSNHAFYKITKKYDEPTKSNLWNVEKTSLPMGDQLPLETIIIFIEPEDFYIPEGITLSNENAQSILPVMYIKSDKNHTINSLASLEINYLFKVIDSVKKS